jgi:hypothetical protein
MQWAATGSRADEKGKQQIFNDLSMDLVNRRKYIYLAILTRVRWSDTSSSGRCWVYSPPPMFMPPFIQIWISISLLQCHLVRLVNFFWGDKSIFLFLIQGICISCNVTGWRS